MEVTAPEFSKKDFKVSIENGVLIISSKRKKGRKKKCNIYKRNFECNSSKNPEVIKAKTKEISIS